MADTPLSIPLSSSESVAIDIKQEASILWQEHRKLEMVATAIAAPASALLVGLLVRPFSGIAMPWGAIVAGLVAAVLSIPITLFLIYSYYFVIAAPRSLYAKSKGQLFETQRLLQTEKAKNAEPRLAGRIDCLERYTDWDTEKFGMDGTRECQLRVTLTLKVTLWGESATRTTILGFKLWVSWKHGDTLAVELPVENYSVRYSIPHSEEWGYETKCRRLVGFRQDVEITNTNHQSGDLRFLARGIPSAPESTDERPIVRDDVTFRLEVLDRKRERHKIYEGTWNGLPDCGSIERDREYFGLELNKP